MWGILALGKRENKEENQAFSSQENSSPVDKSLVDYLKKYISEGYSRRIKRTFNKFRPKSSEY